MLYQHTVNFSNIELEVFFLFEIDTYLVRTRKNLITIRHAKVKSTKPTKIDKH